MYKVCAEYSHIFLGDHRWFVFAVHMSHSQMLGKVEYGGGPIFKVVLEC